MHDFDSTFRKILKNVSADWNRQIIENFRTESFYGKAWAAKSNYPGSRKGKILYRDGDLQGSISVTENLSAGTISASSFVKYANFHNEGGTITVTTQMKKFFWAMHYKASGKVKTKKRGGGTTKASQKYSAEAAYWKAMALMKVGTKIQIKKRQFVGFHPELDASVKKRTDEAVPPGLIAYINSVLKQRK